MCELTYWAMRTPLLHFVRQGCHEAAHWASGTLRICGSCQGNYQSHGPGPARKALTCHWNTQEEEEGEDAGPAEEPEELMKWFGRDWTATASLQDTGRAHSTGDCFEDVGLPQIISSYISSF